MRCETLLATVRDAGLTGWREGLSAIWECSHDEGWLAPVGEIAAPTKTPAEIIARLNKETNSALADPRFTAKIADLRGPVCTTPSEFQNVIVEFTAEWSRLIKSAKIRR